MTLILKEDTGMLHNYWHCYCRLSKMSPLKDIYSGQTMGTVDSPYRTQKLMELPLNALSTPTSPNKYFLDTQVSLAPTQKCIHLKCIFAKCTRLACLLSFASLFLLQFLSGFIYFYLFLSVFICHRSP